MPTAKKRINLTVEDELFEELKTLAKKEKSSIASLSHALLERALELREDLYFSKVGEDRLAKKSKRLKHEDVWD
jgi:predicted DNA-binding protein